MEENFFQIKFEKHMQQNLRHRTYFLIAILFGILTINWVYSEYQKTKAEQLSLAFGLSEVDALVVREKSDTHVIKGIYLTANSAASEKIAGNIIDLIKKTELNAVVIDIKDYTGLVLYDSQISLVNELGLEDDRFDGKIKEVIERFHKEGIYVIARQTVFQDPILARSKPEFAFKSKYGGLWHDHKGLAWVDATNEEVWKYNVDIAKEAIGFGFDEVNFDYIRFPSDGNLSAIAYTNGDKPRYDVMREFFSYLSEELSPYPAYISLDMFGFVMERHDGMSIGQRLEDAVGFVDYICPMMYPSHYPSGHLNLDNPAANPGIVIDNGMKKGTPYFENKRAMVRPWLQAFNMGADYGAVNIRAQIDMVEKYPNAGWLLWNASNRYSTAGLKLEE